jgi:dihydroflavonol-4-reductase
MNAFVTGGTGLLGSNLVELLVREGHAVKVLARSDEKARAVPASPRIEVVKGDLENVAGFAPHLAGCDVLFHCAAYFREYSARGDHAAALRRLNVEATLELIEAARAGGVHDVVHVSSNGATAAPPGGAPQTESCGYDEDTDNLYFRSKIEAEKAIDVYRERHPDVRIVVIRPAIMAGPGDSGPTPAGRLILGLLHGKVPVVLPGNIAVVDARDVARALLAAATRGASGDRFIVGGRAYTFAELVATLGQVSGAPMPRHRPPYPVAMTMLAIAGALGRELPVRARDLRRLHHLRAADSSKAQRILGVEFRDLAQTLRDAVAWFRDHRLQLESADRREAPSGAASAARAP